MPFKTNENRKAFYAQKKHLLDNLRENEKFLTKQKKDFAEKEEIESLKKRIGEVKIAKRRIQMAKFKISPVGKAVNVAGTGVSRVGRGFKRGVVATAEYEKKHGRSQLKKLKKLFK